MNSVKIKVPVIKKTGDFYQKDGDIEIAYESSDLTEAVAQAKQQANKILSELGAECLLVESLDEVQELIRKAKSQLAETEFKRKTAQQRFDALMAFLNRFGVSGNAYRQELVISSQALLDVAVNSKEDVDPIPFDDEDDEEDDEDDEDDDEEL